MASAPFDDLRCANEKCRLKWKEKSIQKLQKLLEKQKKAREMTAQKDAFNEKLEVKKYVPSWGKTAVVAEPEVQIQESVRHSVGICSDKIIRLE